MRATREVMRVTREGGIMRVGEWVLADGKVGIFQGFLDAETAAVDLIDYTTGDTTHPSHPCPVEKITQPKAKDLPPIRVQHLSAEQLRSVGYF